MNHGHRGRGRKQEQGELVQVQVRVETASELKTISDLSPRQRTDAMLAPQHITRTLRRRNIQLTDSLPCSIIKGDGLCRNDAFTAYADEVTITGQRALQGQWLLQPICESCIRAMEEENNR